MELLYLRPDEGIQSKIKPDLLLFISSCRCLLMTKLSLFLFFFVSLGGIWGKGYILIKCNSVLTHPLIETNKAAAQSERDRSLLYSCKVRLKT